MIPWYKITSLVIRIFSKPLITYAKKIPLNETASFPAQLTRRMLISLGNKHRQAEIYINRKFIKSEVKDPLKPLKDEAALEKGTLICVFIKGGEFLSEIVLYSIMIGLPIAEMVRQQIEASEKSEAQKKRIQTIERGIGERQKEHEEVSRELHTLHVQN